MCAMVQLLLRGPVASTESAPGTTSQRPRRWQMPARRAAALALCRGSAYLPSRRSALPGIMMGEGYQYIEIVIFAVVACLLVLRLRSVLGRRTGTERRRDPFAGAPDRPPNRSTDSVITLPRRGSAPAPASAASDDVSGMARLKAADPSFAEGPFLQGARGAFEIIVNAFAACD